MLYSRGMDPLTMIISIGRPAPGYENRVIIPFRWEGRL
jgi:hypothetical protein